MQARETSISPELVRPARGGKSRGSKGTVQPSGETESILTPPRDDTREALFDSALIELRSNLDRWYPMIIGGEPRFGTDQFVDRSPIDTDWTLGHFPRGTPLDARQAVIAARKAFPGWRDLDFSGRLPIIRRAASLLRERSIEIGARLALEVGKSRADALEEIEECAARIESYCDEIERSDRFQPHSHSDGAAPRSRSVLLPCGVWVVLSPFNFPVALAGGPCAAALVTGNTVVFKPSSDAPLAGFELARCFLDAGLPKGVINLVTGPGGSVGEELVSSPEVAGISFSGSTEVGIHIHQSFSRMKCGHPRPCIVEIGGRSAVFVARSADLDGALPAILRSAFGLQGQQSSAASRLFVDREIADELVERLAALTDRIVVGDPSKRDVWYGPVISEQACKTYGQVTGELANVSRIVRGGKRITAGLLSEGYFCEPTIAYRLPVEHRLWRQELFLPIVAVAPVVDVAEAIRLANDSCPRLTAGIFSNEPFEVDRFFDGMEAGTVWANLAKGSVSRARPSTASAGGLLGSGSTGRDGSASRELRHYLREQSQSRIGV
jgi:1-pyrroline-5-carboxylate dehydrogenase